MARYVVLSFEDNDDAEDFIKEMLQDEETIEGLYAKPTQFCNGGGCGTGRIKSFVRGVKYGWWVCGTCKKPTGVSSPQQLMRHVISQGVDLMPDAVQKPASVWTTGWGALGRG